MLLDWRRGWLGDDESCRVCCHAPCEVLLAGVAVGLVLAVCPWWFIVLGNEWVPCSDLVVDGCVGWVHNRLGASGWFSCGVEAVEYFGLRNVASEAWGVSCRPFTGSHGREQVDVPG